MDFKLQSIIQNILADDAENQDETTNSFLISAGFTAAAALLSPLYEETAAAAPTEENMEVNQPQRDEGKSTTHDKTNSAAKSVNSDVLNTQVSEQITSMVS